MPYKDREERLKYMRDYMKKRRAKIDDLERRVEKLEIAIRANMAKT